MTNQDSSAPPPASKDAVQPTVGRVIWFRPYKTDAIAQGGEQPLVGIVTYVNSNNSVNLAVFDQSGHASARTNVVLLQDNDAAPGDRSYAEWPTKDGAKRTRKQADMPATAPATSGSLSPAQVASLNHPEGLPPAPPAPEPVAPVSGLSGAPLSPAFGGPSETVQAPIVNQPAPAPIPTGAGPAV
jgi:hypothetical protein